MTIKAQIVKGGKMTFRFEPVIKGDMRYLVTTHGAQTNMGHAITPTDSMKSEIDSVIDDLIDQLNEIRRQLKDKMK